MVRIIYDKHVPLAKHQINDALVIINYPGSTIQIVAGIAG
jgi:hypothetical protein